MGVAAAREILGSWKPVLANVDQPRATVTVLCSM